MGLARITRKSKNNRFLSTQNSFIGQVLFCRLLRKKFLISRSTYGHIGHKTNLFFAELKYSVPRTSPAKKEKHCDSQPNNSHSNHTHCWMCYNTGTQRYFHPWCFPLLDDCALWTIVFLKNFKGKKGSLGEMRAAENPLKSVERFSIRKVHPIKKIVRLYLLNAHT